MSFPIEAPPEEVVYLPERPKAGKPWAFGLFGAEGIALQNELDEAFRSLYNSETIRKMATERAEASFEDAPPRVIVGRAKVKFVEKPNRLPPPFDEE